MASKTDDEEERETPQMEDSAELKVHSERLEAVIEALSYASVDEFDSCLALLQRASDVRDDFSELETAFSIFVRELAEAKRELNRTLTQQEAVNRELEAKLETIEMQQAAIRELSTPIIEVWAGVLCLPVVGVVDSQRSAEMTETLLETIVAKQARMAIVDITGIDVMDTKTADHFIKMARAVRLLGAECIVSGINPGIAQTLTHIGVDLTGVRTLRSLRDALQLYLRETEQILHANQGNGGRRFIE
jgi:rsbT co-antagonist protein RsbR